MAVEEDSSLVLPPGFRFHPTDEEIISHYLSHKVVNHGFSARAMGEVDLNKCEPWDLPSKAKMGEKEWYFFCQRDRKYPTGMRTNRATESGYWKATGKDKEIYRGTSVLVGMKKTLVFYRGRAPKGEKTNWVMHEYRLEGKFSLSNLPRNAKDEWVVCRVFCKNIVGLKRSPLHGGGGLFRVNSFMEDLLDYSPSLPALTDTAYFANSPSMPSYFSSAADDSLKNPYALNEFPSSSTSYFQPIYGNDQISPYFSASDDMYREPSLAIRKHCKAEQLSNQSMLSHDTGVSTDHNTEISSGITTHERLALYDQRDFEVPSNLPAGAIDLCAMWRC